jgi:hypothetical protein
MYDAHAAGAEDRLQSVLPGVLRLFRFRPYAVAAQRRHDTTPV